MSFSFQGLMMNIEKENVCSMFSGMSCMSFSFGYHRHVLHVDKTLKLVIMRLSNHFLPRRFSMPSYDFKCDKCGGKFGLFISISEYEKTKFRCPKCKSTKVTQQITPFQVKTSKKS